MEHAIPRIHHADNDKIVARFWEKVQKSDGCWLWTGARSPNGYGNYSLGGRSGQRTGAHRVSYVLAKGAIPSGLEIDHLCGVKCCVNPSHLEAVTHLENLRRAPKPVLKGRKHFTICPNGHPYTDGSYSVSAVGKRCLVCFRAKNRKSYLAWKKRQQERGA